MHPDRRQVVEAFLHAIQSGPQGEDQLVALFTDDAVYVQALGPGRPRTYVGRPAIRRALHRSLPRNPPDFQVNLDRLEVEGDELVAYWTCTSERFDQPMRGVDRYTLRGGLIVRLETRLR